VFQFRWRDDLSSIPELDLLRHPLEIMSDPEPASRRLSPLSLKANFAWTFLGNALVAACQLGLLTLLLRQTSDAVTGQYIIGPTAIRNSTLSSTSG